MSPPNKKQLECYQCGSATHAYVADIPDGATYECMACGNRKAVYDL